MVLYKNRQIRLHINNKKADNGCQRGHLLESFINCDWSVIGCKREKFISTYFTQCQTGNMDI